MAKGRGDFGRAIQYIDQAMANSIQKPPHSKPVNLHCIKGRLLLDMGRVEEGKKEFTRAMELSGGREIYALVGLANINYTLSTTFRSDLNMQEHNLRSALNKLFGILEADEHNAYASLGIGTILAEFGKVDEAKEVFKLLATSESDSQIGLDALLNQSHLWMAEGHIDNAINLYKACLAKCPDDLEISMYLSKAYFRKQNFELCKQLTTHKMEKHPNDIRLKYNLAYCLYKEADAIFNLKVRKVAQTKKAIANLKQAKTLF